MQWVPAAGPLAKMVLYDKTHLTSLALPVPRSVLMGSNAAERTARAVPGGATPGFLADICPGTQAPAWALHP
jgi:hypothetical protein